MTSAVPTSKMSWSKWAWVWFAYTGFLFISPMVVGGRRLWIATLVVFVVFAALYFGFVRAANRCLSIPYGMIGACFLLGLLSFPWNPGASCLFIYAAAFLPFSGIAPRHMLPWFLLGSIAIVGEGYLFHGRHGFLHTDWPNTIVAILIMAIVGGSNIFVAQQKRADARLHAAQEENLALAAVAERERIARDLHDVLGHTLSVIALKAELASRLIARGETSDQQRAALEIADLERIARTSLAEVREAIGGYRSRGLAAEIETARQTLDAAGVTLTVDSDAAEADHALSATHLSAAEETGLSLALREAVTNIVRQAHATTCRLRFITQGNQRRLVVEDNGEHAVTREGNGLRGMRERIESLGGRLSLERDNGTRLLIELPLRAQTDAGAAAS